MAGIDVFHEGRCLLWRSQRYSLTQIHSNMAASLSHADRKRSLGETSLRLPCISPLYMCVVWCIFRRGLHVCVMLCRERKCRSPRDCRSCAVKVAVFAQRHTIMNGSAFCCSFQTIKNNISLFHLFPYASMSMLASRLNRCHVCLSHTNWLPQTRKTASS